MGISKLKSAATAGANSQSTVASNQTATSPPFEYITFPKIDISLTDGTNIPAPQPSPPSSAMNVSKATGEIPAENPSPAPDLSPKHTSPDAVPPVKRLAGVRTFLSRLLGGSKLGPQVSRTSSPAPNASDVGTPDLPPNDVNGAAYTNGVGDNTGHLLTPAASVRRKKDRVSGSASYHGPTTTTGADSTASSITANRRRSLFSFISNNQANSRLHSHAADDPRRAPPPSIPEEVLWGAVSPLSRDSDRNQGTDRALHSVPESSRDGPVGSALGINTDELFRNVS